MAHTTERHEACIKLSAVVLFSLCLLLVWSMEKWHCCVPHWYGCVMGGHVMFFPVWPFCISWHKTLNLIWSNLFVYFQNTQGFLSLCSFLPSWKTLPHTRFHGNRIMFGNCPFEDSVLGPAKWAPSECIRMRSRRRQTPLFCRGQMAPAEAEKFYTRWSKYLQTLYKKECKKETHQQKQPTTATHTTTKRPMATAPRIIPRSGASVVREHGITFLLNKTWKTKQGTSLIEVSRQSMEFRKQTCVLLNWGWWFIFWREKMHFDFQQKRSYGKLPWPVLLSKHFLV